MPDRVLHWNQVAESAAPGIFVLETEHSAVDMHAHDFYELVLIKSGFCLHETQKKTELLIEGDCFLMRPGIEHRYIGPHQVELYNCMFGMDALGELSRELNPIPGLGDEDMDAPIKLHLDLSEQKRMSRLLRGIMEDYENRQSGWIIRTKCQLVCLLIDYARALERRAIDPGNANVYPNYVTRALNIIGERYSDSALSVTGIAAEVKVTPDYLSRQFRLLTGVGVQEYLRRFRFAKATELLMNGTPVGETASRVGFASFCHFSREFKKEMGVPPTQYARQNS